MGMRQKGFTIVELAIVLIIFGIVTTTVMFAFTLYNKQKIYSDTDESLKISKQALLEFKGKYGAYPCPADPTLRPGQANYGREMRSTTWPNLTGGCTGYVSYNGVDANGDGSVTDDQVFVGMVPIATLLDPDNNPTTKNGVTYAKIIDQLTRDGWRNKLKYAVSGKLTETDTYNSFMGAIDVRDENANSLLDTGRWAHMVLVSHGPNGRGASCWSATRCRPSPASST